MAALDAVPEMNATLMIVNTNRYGGSGGRDVAVVSRAQNAYQVALHEMGHSHFFLGDEYSSFRERYQGPEPPEANVAMNLEPVKWKEFLSPGTTVPTITNPDCSDARSSAVPAGTVGAFEGARYYGCGLFRPQYSCRMRNVTDEFCVVCQSTIRRVLAPFKPKKQRSAGRR